MKSYKFTILFSCLGYVVQAIAINFSPLLFNTFEKNYSISLSLISLLIGISFTTQFLTDLLVAKFSKKINLRLMCVLAHLLVVIGMIGFSFLPELLPSPYLGLIIPTVLSVLPTLYVPTQSVLVIFFTV